MISHMISGKSQVSMPMPVGTSGDQLQLAVYRMVWGGQGWCKFLRWLQQQHRKYKFRFEAVYSYRAGRCTPGVSVFNPDLSLLDIVFGCLWNKVSFNNCCLMAQPLHYLSVLGHLSGYHLCFSVAAAFGLNPGGLSVWRGHPRHVGWNVGVGVVFSTGPALSEMRFLCRKFHYIRV